jgi:hypothetical protein
MKAFPKLSNLTLHLVTVQLEINDLEALSPVKGPLSGQWVAHTICLGTLGFLDGSFSEKSSAGDQGDSSRTHDTSCGSGTRCRSKELLSPSSRFEDADEKSQEIIISEQIIEIKVKLV